MKFSEKYELLESLTTGAIETFAANDRIRGERVLVHIVECVPQKPDQTTAEWVLESFRKLAPEPAGPVLETGKYSGAKYGYVVIKPADENVVKAWVRRYELHVEDTKETKVHPSQTGFSAPAAAPRMEPPIPPKEPPQAPGQMTQLFRDFDSLAKSKVPDPAVPPGHAFTCPGRPARTASMRSHGRRARQRHVRARSPGGAGPCRLVGWVRRRRGRRRPGGCRGPARQHPGVRPGR